jgi:predicted nucleotide-binding protein
MRVPLLVNPKSRHLQRILAAVDEANRVQNYVWLEYLASPWLPDQPSRKRLDTHVLHHIIQQHWRRGPDVLGALAVTERQFQPGYFTDEFEGLAVLSLHDWELKYTPPPIRTFILYELAYAVLAWSIDISTDRMDHWYHPVPQGCVADQYNSPKELRRSMGAANLCAECEAFVVSMGIQPVALSAAEKMLNHVRGMVIRRPRTLPRNVFIGHGRSRAWEDVRDFVHELGLEVEEFNQEATAGMTTTARLNSMMEASAFAILVMTGEDRRSEGTLHARENVVHEIGLFQGRLGNERAIVLRQEGTSIPSNLHGLTYIEFPKRGFKVATPARAQVRAALDREGLLPPGTGASPAARPAPRPAPARGTSARPPRPTRPRSSPKRRPRSG